MQMFIARIAFSCVLVTVLSVAPRPALAVPGISVTPLVLDFGEVGVGVTSPTQVVTITNTGDELLTDFAGGAPFDTQFGASQNCAGGVAPGDSCQYFFTFTPTATGAFESTSNTSTNAGPFVITLRGTGAGAGLHVTPLELDFGPVVVGVTSPTQVVTIANPGLAELNEFAGGAPFDTQFGASQNCAGGVAPGDSCQYFFTFTPTATGAFESTSNTSTNAGPFIITLRGQGALAGKAVMADPASLDFGSLPIGEISAPQTVIFRNVGDESVTVTSVAAGAPFLVDSENCTPGLAPGVECQVEVVFAPVDPGNASDQLVISHDAPDSPAVVTLTGTGLGPRTTFRVTKSFDDGNPGQVDVTLTCNTGLPLQQTTTIMGDDPGGVLFVVTEFANGGMDCTVTETPVAGYSATYSATPGGVSPTNCSFTGVAWGAAQSCQITNSPDPVMVAVTKDWVVNGPTADALDLEYQIVLTCDAEIVGGECNLEGGQGLNPAPGTCTMVFAGAGSETHYAEVVPDYPSSSCSAVETVYDSAVEVDNGCTGLTISAGAGASCTIVNAVFFEGIPTLSQWGLAVLAALMLGIGLVGLRRFV